MKPDGLDIRDRAPADLAQLQALLYRLIVAPNGVDDGLARESALAPGALDLLIVGDDRLSARARLTIYANAYFYRILDALKDDFPANLTVLGERAFHNLITAYLVVHPPQEPSIAEAGRALPGFIRTHPPDASIAFLANLAALERAAFEAFHGPDAAPLTAEKLRAIPPHDWPALMLRAHPTVRILQLDFRVDLTLRAIEAGAPWTMPEHTPTHVLVWRRGTQTHYRVLETDERSAMRLLQDGATFAAICDAVAADAGDAAGNDEVAALVNRMLARWLSEGLIVRVAASA
jgi:hypothetical protein